MKKFLIFMGLCFAFGLQAAKNSNRPMAIPNKKLSKVDEILRDVSDFLLFESYGFHAISENNQTYINAIIHELKMDDYCIEMRGMSNAAQASVGRMNAFVVPSIINKKNHAFLFISEEWFDSLTDLEKQGLIRHELMHIKCNHMQQKVVCNWASLAMLAALYYSLSTAVKNHKMNDLLAGGMLYAGFFGVLFASAKVSRISEKEADIEAAKTMKDKQGLIDLFNNFRDHSQDPESRFAIKRAFINIVEFICTPLTKLNEILGSHPTLDERIAYISELK